MIIPALHERQTQRGYLSKSDLTEIAETLDVPLHRINAVVSFFPHFRTTPPPKVCIDVCRDMSCHLRGSVKLADRMRAWAKRYDSSIEVHGVSCLGRCDRAPAAMVNESLVANADEVRLQDVALDFYNDRKPKTDSDWQLARAKVGHWDMDIYQGDGRYEMVKKFIDSDSDAKGVISSLEQAGLLGMGGAGGRAYLKWSDVREAKSSKNQKYVVCNADESEPGTFKDRDILLAAPHLVIEGMILGGLVVGATKGYVYVRHEYPEQINRCRDEILKAKRLGALGKGIFGSERSMEIEVFPSPGGYICGEQTALIEAMEGKRAEPRNRPPELMTNGLHDQPTLLSNVETFSWVPAIMKDSGIWFSEQGSRDGKLSVDSSSLIKGKRIFSISGDVAKPGAYEVPTGISLGQLIDDYCGGMRNNVKLLAVALSGPSGGLLPAQIPVWALESRFAKRNFPEEVQSIDIRQLPLDINVSRAVGYMLGAGIVVYGEGCDLLAEAVANSRFFRNESCGKCVPCRIGSQKITQVGERLLSGQMTRNELKLMEPAVHDLAGVMQATSICGLGQVASNPLQSFLRFFPELAEAACQSNSNKETQR